ncbi:hypothetical protein R3P38DRAFT_2780296 [Favolaschia claudopus]|uniref:Uncharacterized protein n=1 Tax=Favolaschia claudopus TaxID=2862362 RepID=A0AAW0B966_9AGAR
MYVDTRTPEDRQRSRDYRLAGFVPTLGSANRARMLERGRARLAEIQAIQEKHRVHVEKAAHEYKQNSAYFSSLADVVATTSPESGERFPHVDSAIARGLGRTLTPSGENATPMDPTVYAGIKASLSPNRPVFVLPQISHSLKKRRVKGVEYSDDDYTIALADAMVDNFKAGLGDPSDLWRYPPCEQDSDSDASDECDADSVPRLKISTRIAQALVIAASTLGKLEMRVDAEDARLKKERYAPSPRAWLMMQPVYASIREVGACKRSSECREVGPAQVGYSHIQVHDQVYLRKDLDGSTSYVGEAALTRVRTRP